MQPLDSPIYARSKPWHWGVWFGWSVLLALTLAASALAAFFIGFGDSTTCNERPTSANVAHGQLHLLIAAGVLAGPWILATFLSPKRWPRMLLGFLVGVLPLALMSLTHLQAHDWTGGFCF